MPLTRDGLIKLREKFKKAIDSETKRILVCAGTGCISSGSLDIFNRLTELLAERGVKCSVELSDDADGESCGVKKSGCHGFCEKGPLLRIEPQGWLYTKVSLDDCEEIIDKTIIKGEHIERLAYCRNGIIYKRHEEIPFYKKQTRIVLEHCGHIDATSIEEYLGIGGYRALERALFELTPDEIINEITESNLRGRGGGGFPGRGGRTAAQ